MMSVARRNREESKTMKHWQAICGLLLLAGCGDSREPIKWTPLEDLLNQLKDSDAGNRYSALSEIIHQGPAAAKQATPQIVAALNDKDANVRIRAAEAVTLCGLEAAA